MPKTLRFGTKHAKQATQQIVKIIQKEDKAIRASCSYKRKPKLEIKIVYCNIKSKNQRKKLKNTGETLRLSRDIWICSLVRNKASGDGRTLIGPSEISNANRCRDIFYRVDRKQRIDRIRWDMREFQLILQLLFNLLKLMSSSQVGSPFSQFRYLGIQARWVVLLKNVEKLKVAIDLCKIKFFLLDFFQLVKIWLDLYFSAIFHLAAFRAFVTLVSFKALFASSCLFSEASSAALFALDSSNLMARFPILSSSSLSFFYSFLRILMRAEADASSSACILSSSSNLLLNKAASFRASSTQRRAYHSI